MDKLTHMALIELKNLTLSYPIYGKDAQNFKSSILNFATGGALKKDHKTVYVEALKDITFSLNKGDRLGLIGHNGAGKSSLLKVLAKIYTPSSGDIHIHGNSNCLFDLMMGMDPELTGYENIFLRGRLAGLSKKKILTIIDQVVSFAEIGDFLKMPLKTYSAGMQIRLAFGIISNISSEILLIDEIINVGDAQFMQKAHAKLEELIDASEILVLSSHEISILKKFCNKVLWLNHGKMVLFGAIDDVVASYNQSLK